MSKCARCIVGSSMMILLMLNAGWGVSELCHLLDYPVNPYSYQWVTHYDVDRFDDEFDLIAGLLYLWLPTVICG